MSDTFKSRHSPHADLREQGQDTERMHITCTLPKPGTLAARLDAARGTGVPRTLGTCDRHGCEVPATDRRRGLSWCREHFMWVLTWEAQA